MWQISRPPANGASLATHKPMMKYKLALCLFKIYYTDFNSVEFSNLSFNQILTGRQTQFKTMKNNNFKVGINSLANRLSFINGDKPL